MSSKIVIDNVSGTITADGQPITGGGGGSSIETTNVVASALAGTVNIDTETHKIHYYTSNATANWTPNIRSNSSATLDSAMSVGDTMTVTILATLGNGFYSAALQIDGVSITPKWASGLAPTAGSMSSIDVYSYTIVKTAAATWTVLASVSQFA